MNRGSITKPGIYELFPGAVPHQTPAVDFYETYLRLKKVIDDPWISIPTIEGSEILRDYWTGFSTLMYWTTARPSLAVFVSHKFMQVLEAFEEHLDKPTLIYPGAPDN